MNRRACRHKSRKCRENLSTGSRFIEAVTFSYLPINLLAHLPTPMTTTYYVTGLFEVQEAELVMLKSIAKRAANNSN